MMNSSELKQATLAIMFGDSYVDVNYRSGKARLDIYHCEEQLPYLLWKRELLESITGVTCKVTEKIDKRPLKGSPSRKGYRLQTNFSRYFFNLHQTPEKFKIKQLVKPLALAVLWQDDGTLCITAKGNYSTATLCTDSWDEGTVREFNKRFNNQYGWCMNWLDYRCRGKTYPRLRMRKKQMQKFSEIVKSYTQECLQYKLLHDL